ncbi:MAG TPA: hypothetical protein PLQ18_02145 [Plasticicumulans sp.]|nr:hypothetical protein [Plasticicumulans sp.]
MSDPRDCSGRDMMLSGCMTPMAAVIARLTIPQPEPMPEVVMVKPESEKHEARTGRASWIIGSGAEDGIRTRAACYRPSDFESDFRPVTHHHPSSLIVDISVTWAHASITGHHSKPPKPYARRMPGVCPTW